MLRKQTLSIPLGQGVDTKADPRALNVPRMAAVENAVFDEIGGLQKRPGFASLSTNVQGGGTLSNIRRIATYDDELLCFTDDALYTFNDRDDTWVSRGTYYAPKITEKSVFSVPGNQTQCERAELSNVIVYAWLETVGATQAIFLAAVDKNTGATIVAPTSQGTGADRPRLIALTDKILFIYKFSAGIGLVFRALDPDTIATDIADTAGYTDIDADFGGYFDAVKLSSTTAVVVNTKDPTTSYQVSILNEAATVVSTDEKARTSEDAIAVSVSTEAGRIAVFRRSSTNIIGDNLNSSTLADVDVNVTVYNSVSTLNQITAVHKTSTDGGVYRAYCFWSDSETTGSTDFSTWVNYLDTGGSAGTTASFVHRVGVASRAFIHDGVIRVILAFSGQASTSNAANIQLENCYFLYRFDASTGGAILEGRIASFNAAGFAASVGCLPYVTNTATNEFKLCLEERALFVGGATSGSNSKARIATAKSAYADRGPRDVTITFDSDDARITAQVGKTLYITGGQILQYDGAYLVELGFFPYPWEISLTASGAGSMTANASYSYRQYLEWTNARGERERSTTGLTKSVAMGSAQEVDFTVIPLHTTLKRGSAPDVSILLFRSAADPTPEALYRRVTSLNPADTGTDNCYIENAPTSASVSFSDSMADTTLLTKELDPASRSEVDPVAPNPAYVIGAGQNRLFLANGDKVQFSKLHFQGEIVHFSDALEIIAAGEGGDITAVCPLDSQIIIFKEKRIYTVLGEGPNNTQTEGSYSSPQLLSSDTGCTSGRTVAAIPQGILFLSERGWYVLDRAGGLQYVGAPVEDYNSQTFVAATLMEDKHRVVLLASSGSSLMYDYATNQWSTWSITGLDAVMWQGTYVYAASSTALRKQDTSFQDAGTGYALAVETPWIKLSDLQNWGRVWKVLVLGEYRSDHNLRIRIAYNYNTTWIDDTTWTVSPTTVGGPEQVRIGPSRQKCQAIKIRIQDVQDGEISWAEGVKLTGIDLELGLRGTAVKLPSAQST